MIVADTNLIVHAFLPGNETEEAREVFRKSGDWAAPLLWKSEFRNVLSTYMRRKELTLNRASVLMQEAEAFLHGKEQQIGSSEVLALAAVSGCSAYDCEFIALAEFLNAPLVTHDRQILRAFPEIASTPRAFLAR